MALDKLYHSSSTDIDQSVITSANDVPDTELRAFPMLWHFIPRIIQGGPLPTPPIIQKKKLRLREAKDLPKVI